MENIYAKIIARTSFEQLPDVWKNIDFHTFLEGKTLYAYQREAIQNALLLLFRFYQNQATKNTEALKTEFLSLLGSNGFTDAHEEHFISRYDNKNAFEILTSLDKSGKEYFKIGLGNKIDAHNFVNRMSFWMATGSGKSMVLIKLIELLHSLMANDLILHRDMLFLTHRQDLIEQLKAHIYEFNRFIKVIKGIEVVVRDLKEFPDQKIKDSLFREKEIAIYFYRSDLLSDIRKDVIVDFKTYENGGNWYMILDEAHKGDNEESKRKQYFNILSRNGFLFNFSATFTEEIDKISTVYNLNLGEYIRKGFGKHLYLFQEQFQYFDLNREKEDYKDEQKQKIVLMSLILLAYIKKRKEALNLTEVYHNPMLVTLVNSVSKKDSDLDLFFSELRKMKLRLICLSKQEKC
jgi:type III restriction enzyme